VASGLTKRFGRATAVDGLSFAAEPGLVTGFLGPNGVGNPVTGLRRSLLARPGGDRCRAALSQVQLWPLAHSYD
jgi:ABC-2 type transport system ATP-binding protein